MLLKLTIQPESEIIPKITKQFRILIYLNTLITKFA